LIYLPCGVFQGGRVPIGRLTQGSPFTPDEIRLMTIAFEDACRVLGLDDPANASRDLVAKKIIEAAQAGERNQERLRECGLSALR
jgi:hypothetical protein